MPRAYDRHRLTLDHDPTRNIFGLPNIPQFDLGKLIADSLAQLLQQIIDNIGQLIQSAAEWLFQGSAELLRSIVESTQALFSGDWSALPIAPLLDKLFPDGIPLSKLVSEPQNELWNADFRSAISLVGGTDWTWTPDVSFADSTATGSATATCDGSNKALSSNPISVPAGKSLTLSVQVLADGLAGTGTPIQLWAAPESGSNELLDAVLPSGGASGWNGAPAGATSAVLNAAYTPPEGAGPVQMVLAVDKTATAGTVYFDHAQAYVTGGWLERTWTQIGDILDAYANAETSEQFAAAFDLVLDLLALPHPDDFWPWVAELFLGPLDFFVTKEFWDAAGVLFAKAFSWLTTGGASTPWADVVTAWNTVAGYFNFTPPTATDFWSGVIGFVAGPWVSTTFVDKATTLVGALLGRMNGTATQVEVDAAWSAAWDATMTLEAPQSWRWVLKTVRLVSDLSTLLDRFFGFLGGDVTQDDLTAAFGAVMTDLGLPVPDTSFLFRDVISSWLLPEWLQPTSVGATTATGGGSLDDAITRFVNSIILGAGADNVGQDGSASSIGDAFTHLWNAIFHAQSTADNALANLNAPPPDSASGAYRVAGTHTVTVESGMKAQFNLLGAGGGGKTYALFLSGDGGRAGQWAWTEIVGPATVTVQVGAGGAAGTIGSPTGKAGGDSTVSTGSTVRARASGGAGATAQAGTTTEVYGEGAGSFSHFTGLLSVGGGTQAIAGRDGYAPGGGGAGQGYGLGPVGSGADGAVFWRKVPA